MESIVIREMILSDLESLAALYSDFWGDVSDMDKMRKEFTRLAVNPDYILLCADVDKQIAGSVMGVVCRELYGECTPFLVMENFIVGREYRRMGIGGKLLAELEERGRGLHCSQIQFITETNRSDALGFYTSRGYSADTHIGFKKKL